MSSLVLLLANFTTTNLGGASGGGFGLSVLNPQVVGVWQLQVLLLKIFHEHYHRCGVVLRPLQYAMNVYIFLSRSSILVSQLILQLSPQHYFLGLCNSLLSYINSVVSKLDVFSYSSESVRIFAPELSQFLQYGQQVSHILVLS